MHPSSEAHPPDILEKSNATAIRRGRVPRPQDREDPGRRGQARGGLRSPRHRRDREGDHGRARGRGPAQRGGARGPPPARLGDGALEHHLHRDVQDAQEEDGPGEGHHPVKLSREKVLRLSHLILDRLNKDEEVEYFADPQEIRQEIVKLISDEMKTDEAIDAIVRRKIETQKRSIVEGSDEWDVLYRKYYEEEVGRHRKVMP